MSVVVTISKMIYPQGCLEEAIIAYSAICSVKVCRDAASAREIEIAFLPNQAEQSDENRVTHEFLNYLLDLSLEHHLQKF